jgi:phage-related minor tail protein
MAGIEAGILNVLISPKLVSDFASKLGFDLEKGVGDAGSKAGESLGKRLGEGFTKTGKNLTKTVTAPIVAGFGLLIANALKVDDAFDTLRAKTGAVGVEAEKLQESFKKVASNVPASLEKVADTVAGLSVQFEGLANKDLENLSTSFLQLEEVTGKALDPKAYADVAKRFGISNNELVGGLDKLLRASQTTGVEISTLNEKLRANASVLTELGFSYSDSLGFIASFEKAGFDSSKALVGLRRAFLTALGGDKELIKTQGALAEQTEARNTALSALAVEEAKLRELESKGTAGTKEYAKELEKISKLQTDLKRKREDLAILEQKIRESQTVSAQGGAKQSASQIASQNLSVQRARDEIALLEKQIGAGPQVEGAAGSDILAQQKKIEALKATIESSGAAITNFEKTISDQAKKSGTSIGEFVLNSIEEIKRLSQAGDEAAANAQAKALFGRSALDVLQAVEAGAFDFTALAKEIEFGSESVESAFFGVIDFPQQLEIFRNRLGLALQPIGAQLFPVIEKSISTVLPLIEKLVALFTSLPSGVQTGILAFAGIAAAVGPVLVGLGQLITAYTAVTAAQAATAVSSNILRAALAGIGIGLLITAIVLLIQNWDTVKRVALEAFQKIKEAVATAFEYIKNNWQTLLPLLLGPFGAAFTLIKVIWGNLKGVVSGAIGGIRSVLGGIADLIARPFKNAYDGIIRFFTNVRTTVGNVINAIKNSFNSLVTAISNAINAILRLPGFSQIAKIFSGVGGAFRALTGARAEGGPIKAGGTYLVGERGPEIVVPKNSGYVLPNNVLQGMIGGGSGATYNVTINNPVAEPAATSIPAALKRANLLRG